MRELALLGVCAAVGVALCGLYLLFGLLRKSGGTVGTVIADVLFAATAFAPLVCIAAFFNDGIIAGYTAVGEALGFAAAYASARKIRLIAERRRGDKRCRKAERTTSVYKAVGTLPRKD